MPDAVTHTNAALTTASGAASIAAGTVFGVEFYVIGLALLGGAISHIWVKKRLGLFEIIISILGSSALGIVAALLSYDLILLFGKSLVGDEVIAHLKEASGQGKMLVAFSVAFLAQKGVPILFKWMDEKGGNA